MAFDKVKKSMFQIVFKFSIFIPHHILNLQHLGPCFENWSSIVLDIFDFKINLFFTYFVIAHVWKIASTFWIALILLIVVADSKIQWLPFT